MHIGPQRNRRLGALFYDDYSILLNKISEWGGNEATSHAIQNRNFMLLGLLVLGFSGALHYDLSRLGVRTKGSLILAVFGLSIARLNSVLPCDASCDGTTTEALLHTSRE